MVELLVVVGIIAILIAVLMPALQKARKQAQTVQCASNMRQLYLACQMFAQDNGGHLPSAHQVPELSANPQFARVRVWTHLRAGAAGHADVSDEGGAIWKYIKGEESRKALIMCPGDTGEALNGWPVMAQFPRNYSYSLNWLVNQQKDVTRGGSAPLIGIRLASVRAASERIMWYEELAPNDTWCIMGRHIADIPSARHGSNLSLNALRSPNSKAYNYAGLGNMCFFDGHVIPMSPQELIGNPQLSPRWHCPLVEGDPTTF